MIADSQSTSLLLNRRISALLLGASALAMGTSAAYAQVGLPAAPPPGSSQASDLPSAPGTANSTGNAAEGSGNKVGGADEVVVTGIRAANISAIRIKRNADTIVDAITAEDIGALPDKSITETLQRVPGVAVNRFAQVNDPDHVSEEGQSPVIRGLPYVNSQFNGRDAFTANGGRALNFQDIPPDLAASVEVYKNQTADQIEGGIAGNINIVTRRPLDSVKNFAVLNANVNYGDLRKKATPEVSGIITHQWDTSIGRIGVLASGSYSKISEQVDNGRVTTYRDFRAADPSRTLPASDRGALPGGAPGVDYYVPLGGGYSRQTNDRRRLGYSGALQWESNDGNLLATLQYIGTNTRQAYLERTVAPVEDTGTQSIVGGVSSATFDANNVLLKGLIGNADGTGIQTQELSRGQLTHAKTNDFSGHLAWKATDRLKFDFDGQYAKSTSDKLDASVVAVTDAFYQVDETGSRPSAILKRPTNFLTNAFAAVPLGSVTSSTSPTADPATTFWRSAQDHQDNTRGHEWAFRGDGELDVSDDGFFRRIKFGARYADRKQVIRADGYNWGNLSERWNGGFTTVGQSTPPGFGTVNVNNFLRNGNNDFVLYGFQGNPALSYDQLISGAGIIRAVKDQFCTFRALGTGVRSCAGPPTPASLATIGAGDGFHNLGEVSHNDETTYAGYGRIDFGAKDIEALGGLTIDGNIGLRYVHTRSVSSGFYSVPAASAVFGIQGTTLNCSTYVPSRTPGQFLYNICLNTPAQQQALLTFFGNGGTLGSYTPSTTRQSYNNWLPSFNLRVAPSDKMQFRFAYSKAITRPSFNDLRNYTQFSLVSPVGSLTSDQPYPAVAVKGQAYGNPLLRPTKSDNYDITQEWYYSNSGSLTLAAFYKKVTNVYSVLNGQATFNGNAANNIGVDPANPSSINFTNNGVTVPAFISVTNNNKRSVGIRGIEFDWRENTIPYFPGFGFSANFTFIDADRLQDQPVLAANFDTARGTYSTATGYLTSFPFPGISKYNANAELFYENYGISARVAYSWRSSYFVSSQDSLGPNDPTYTKASGFVDGSIAYAINQHIKVVVTGSNLLNEKITTTNQISQSGLRALRGVNEADRRFTAGVRLGL